MVLLAPKKALSKSEGCFNINQNSNVLEGTDGLNSRGNLEFEENFMIFSLILFTETLTKMLLTNIGLVLIC